MKLKFSLIVALCAVMGLMACAKDKKNAAKLRMAKTEAIKRAQEAQRQVEEARNSTGGGVTAAGAPGTQNRAQESLFSSNLEISAVEGNTAITTEIKLVNVNANAQTASCTSKTENGVTNIVVNAQDEKEENEKTIVTKASFSFDLNEENPNLKISSLVISEQTTEGTKIVFSAANLNADEESAVVFDQSGNALRINLNSKATDTTSGKIINLEGEFKCTPVESSSI